MTVFPKSRLFPQPVKADADRQHAGAHAIHQRAEEQRRCRLRRRHRRADNAAAQSVNRRGRGIANGTARLAFVKRQLQHRESGDRARSYHPKDNGSDRMQEGGETRRHERMHLRSAPNSTTRAATDRRATLCVPTLRCGQSGEALGTVSR
jgi:hypothetical protein